MLGRRSLRRGLLAAAVGGLALTLAAPASALRFIPVNGGRMTITLTKELAARSAGSAILILPAGATSFEGKVTVGATEDGAPTVKTTKTLRYGLAVSSGFLFLGHTPGPFPVGPCSQLSLGGGIGFTNMPRGASALFQAQGASFGRRCFGTLFGPIGGDGYFSIPFTSVDASAAKIEATRRQLTVRGLRLRLTFTGARALNDALRTSAFSSGQLLGDATVKVSTTPF